jgi:hypothetical protein
VGIGTCEHHFTEELCADDPDTCTAGTCEFHEQRGDCWPDCWHEWAGASCVVYDHDTGAARCYAPKNRYLTIDPRCADSTALHIALDTTRVEFLDEQYSSCGLIEGYLTEPICIESDTGEAAVPQPDPTDPCQGQYDCGQPDLCTYFGWISYVEPGPGAVRQWQEYPLLVTGCQIVPAATYLITASSDGLGPDLGPSLEIMTAHRPGCTGQRWGDISGGPVEGLDMWLPGEGVTGINDVQFVIMTIAYGPVNVAGSPLGGPRLEWCDMEIDHVVSLSDMQFVIAAFEARTMASYVEVPDNCLQPLGPSSRPIIGHEPCDCWDPDLCLP